MDLTNPVTEEMEKINRELPSLIERLHQEYNKYFTGAEKKPPLKLREQVDKQADRLRTLLRQCQSHQISFRSQNTINKYNSYKAMWDKKLMEREQSAKR